MNGLYSGGVDQKAIKCAKENKRDVIAITNHEFFTSVLKESQRAILKINSSSIGPIKRRKTSVSGAVRSKGIIKCIKPDPLATNAPEIPPLNKMTESILEN